MLNHSEELFHPLPSKIVNCYGEYEKEFDEFHPDVNELIKGHDKFSNCAGPFDVPMTHVLLIYLLVISDSAISNKYALDNVSAMYKYLPGVNSISKLYLCNRRRNLCILGGALAIDFAKIDLRGL